MTVIEIRQHFFVHLNVYWYRSIICTWRSHKHILVDSINKARDLFTSFILLFEIVGFMLDSI